MARIAGTNISLNTPSANQFLMVGRIDPSNCDQIKDEVTAWAEYNWANSAYWIIPNLMNAITSEREAQFIVPILNYDGPTGEVETITCTPVKY